MEDSHLHGESDSGDGSDDLSQGIGEGVQEDIRVGPATICLKRIKHKTVPPAACIT